MNYVDLERATRCANGNKFFIQAKAQRVDVGRYSRALQKAIEGSRFTSTARNREKFDKAVKEVKTLISMFEEHLSECERCSLNPKVLETV